MAVILDTFGSQILDTGGIFTGGGPSALTDYTFCFGSTGFIFNTDSVGLPFIDVESVTGLDDAPLRVNTAEHAQMDGTYVDTPYISMRTIAISGILYTSPFDTDALLDQLKASYASNVVRPFYYKLPNRPVRYVNGQGGGFQYPIDTNRRLGITKIQAVVLAGDPYIYDYPAQVVTTGSPSVITTGMSFNTGFNISFGGGVPPAQGVLTNNGTLTAYPLITLTGPLTNPVISDGNGTTMSFSITLNAGDILVIDCRYKSVVLNGVQNRRSALAGLKWISVPPGTSDTINLNAATGTGTAQLSMSNTYY